jgi:type II secretory pathway component GspD/PulD (secretin)
VPSDAHIAGMTLGSSARSHAGIPFLSHIPFLGRLFSKNGRSEREFKDLVYVEGKIILFEEIEAGL